MNARRPFNYDRKPETCLWCGKKIARKFFDATVYHANADQLRWVTAETRARLEEATGEITCSYYEGWREDDGIRGKLREIPRVGYSYPPGAANEVERIVAFAAGSNRHAKPGEPVGRYRIWFKNGGWTGYTCDDKNGTEFPVFDTDSCAVQFGWRFAELGHRLFKTAATGGSDGQG